MLNTKKSLIIKDAIEMAKEGGVKNISIDKLMKAHNQYRPSFYRYFKPDEIILHINSYTMELIRSRLSTIAAQQISNPEKIFTRIANECCSLSDEYPHLWNILFEYEVTMKNDLPEWSQKEVDETMGQLMGVFHTIFPKLDKQTLAIKTVSFWSGIQGAISLFNKNKVSASLNIDKITVLEDFAQSYYHSMTTTYSGL